MYSCNNQVGLVYYKQYLAIALSDLCSLSHCYFVWLLVHLHWAGLAAFYWKYVMPVLISSSSRLCRLVNVSRGAELSSSGYMILIANLSMLSGLLRLVTLM